MSGLIWNQTVCKRYPACVVPESFARGGPTFFLFLDDEGKRIQITLKVCHQQPARETPF